MNILVFNQNWFVRDLRAAGHHVVTCGISKHLDIYLEAPLIHIDSLIKELPADQKPDAILVLDNSAPVLVTGLEESPIPIVFYAVDTHHHTVLHTYLAHVFDRTFVAHKDYLPCFSSAGLQAEWMPLWASEYVEPQVEKRHGAVFVGTLDAKLNPDRVAFFNALQQKVDILCTTGFFPHIFPYSEIVINQTVKRDLNFRVFEAMMCGAMLLTERIENGLFDLFREGEHLVTYEKGSVDEAAELIRYYLANTALCRKIAAQGREEILARHLESHRSAVILEALKTTTKKSTRVRYLAAMANYAILGRNVASIDTAASNRAHLQALRAAERGIQEGEQFTDDLTCLFLLSAIKYDAALNCRSGAQLIEKASEANPQNVLLALAKMRSLLNRGSRRDAEVLAQRINAGEDSYITFLKAEKAIASLLAENA